MWFYFIPSFRAMRKTSWQIPMVCLSSFQDEFCLNTCETTLILKFCPLWHFFRLCELIWFVVDSPDCVLTLQIPAPILSGPCLRPAVNLNTRWQKQLSPFMCKNLPGTIFKMSSQQKWCQGKVILISKEDLLSNCFPFRCFFSSKITPCRF